MSEPGVGRFLVAFTVQGAVFLLLLSVIELQCVRTFSHLLASLWRRRKQVGELREFLRFVCCHVAKMVRTTLQGIEGTTTDSSESPILNF